jgi:hypothetical protein
VPKLTSEISSSLSVIARPAAAALSRDGTSNASPLVAADAPPASEKDTPTSPNTGTASFKRFRFEPCLVCRMSVLSCLLGNTRCPEHWKPHTIGTPCTRTLQDRYRGCARYRAQLTRGLQAATAHQNAPSVRRVPDFMNDIVTACALWQCLLFQRSTAIHAKALNLVRWI